MKISSYHKKIADNKTTIEQLEEESVKITALLERKSTELAKIETSELELLKCQQEIKLTQESISSLEPGMTLLRGSDC